MAQRIIAAGHICLDITPVFPSSVRGQPLQALLQPGKLLQMEGADVHTGGSVANTGLLPPGDHVALQRPAPYPENAICVLGSISPDETFGALEYYV